MRRTSTFSMPVPPSRLGTVRRLLFGTPLGSLVASPKTLLRSFTRLPLGSTGRYGRPSRTTRGSSKSDRPHRFPSSMLRNSSPFGCYYMRYTWMSSLRMTSCGRTWNLGTSQWPLLTGHGFWAWSFPPWTKWFGRVGPHRSQVLCLACFRIGSGLLTDWRSEDGLTVAPAPCADGCRNVALIFSSDAASLSGFGTWLFRNFASTTWTRPHGTCLTPFMPGGRAHAPRAPPTEKQRHRLPC